MEMEYERNSGIYLDRTVAFDLILFEGYEPERLNPINASMQPASFFASGMQKLVDRWDKCLNELGRYVQNETPVSFVTSYAVYWFASASLANP